MWLASLLLLIGPMRALQGSPQGAATQKPSATGFTSLRIRLRLEDDSPFSGSATVRVIPSEGYEVSGTMESEGEMVFADVPPGSYTLEASAPGFLTLRQKIQVEKRQGLLTRFVVMKPRPFPVRVAEKPVAAPSPLAIPTQTSWTPAGIDEAVPYVDPDMECPLPQVLNGVGQRMKQFVSNLEKFTASERVEHFVIDGSSTRRTPDVRNFDYVVMVSRTSTGVFLLDEYRNGSADPAQFPANIATQGMPAIALLFHPLLAPDFSFACEGLGQWEGHAAWQVHFVQRPDRPGRILSYSAGGKYSSLALKGRAWIDPGTFQLFRLESQLAQPLKELGLTEEHIAISYQPVQFRTLGQQLWLPQIAELYVERQGRRYYRRHTLSDFRLFTVETTQNIQLAKESYGFTNQSDRDITGVLTVNPVSGARFGPVSVSFTIPAGGSVVKLIGLGKDVGIPVESVGSATFAHDGPLDSVKVDAHLSKESTLDVISGTSTPQPQ